MWTIGVPRLVARDRFRVHSAGRRSSPSSAAICRIFVKRIAPNKGDNSGVCYRYRRVAGLTQVQPERATVPRGYFISARNKHHQNGFQEDRSRVTTKEPEED